MRVYNFDGSVNFPHDKLSEEIDKHDGEILVFTPRLEEAFMIKRKFFDIAQSENRQIVNHNGRATVDKVPITFASEAFLNGLRGKVFGALFLDESLNPDAMEIAMTRLRP